MLRKMKLRWFRRAEIADEIRVHLEQLEDELVAGGMARDEARRAARRQFGNATAIHEQSRDVFSLPWLQDMSRDLRFSWRSLRRNPSVAVAAVLSMGLAIGANTVVFSLIQEIFFTLPTTRDADRLVMIRLGGSSHASLPNLRDLEAQDILEHVTGFDVETEVNWRLGDEVRRLPIMLVAENYFELIETRPALGRVFRKEEARAEGNPHFVVISHRLWTRTFNQDPEMTGRSLVINGRPYAVLGVLPEGFRPPTFLNILPDLYLPASPELKPSLFNRDASGLMLIARRKPGQSLQQAFAAVQVAGQRLADAYPKENAGMARSVRVLGITSIDPDAAPLLLFAGVLVLAVFVVLWIACTNVAGLLIARSAARRREIATRLAIGASRARLVRQLLAESLLLACLGAAAGLVLHSVLTSVLNNITIPLPIPIVFQMKPNLWLLAYAIGLTALAATLAGLLPALQSTRPGLTSGLKLEEPQYGHRRWTLRNLLVVGQVAVTVVLLSVGMLFTRSLMRVNSLAPGFDLTHTVWAKVSVVNDRYEPDQLPQFAERVIATASSVPGVRSAAMASAVPFNNFMRSGTEAVTESGSVRVEFYATRVSAAYFDTMSIPMLAGRTFDASDRKGAPEAVILNQAMAERLFKGQNAVGRKIRFGGRPDGASSLVVGVAGNVKHMTMSEDQAMAVYYAMSQSPQTRSAMNILVRAEGDAQAVTAGVRRAIAALDDTAAVEVAPLRNKLAFAYLPSQIGAALVGTLGLLGLLLAVIGIYGTMAFVVSRRTAEIGIRMALGASQGQVLRAVLATSAGAMLAGLLIGVGLALGAAQPLASFLAEGVSASDPLTFTSVIFVCLVAGLVAAVVPARRALGVAPMITLRVD